jgi:uncharacterized membrane protein YccC
LTISGIDRRLDDWSDRVGRLQEMQSDLSAKMDELTRVQASSVEDLALRLTPVAEAMARLTEESRQTLERVVTQSRQGHAEAVAAVKASTKTTSEAAARLSTGMVKVEDQVRQLQEAAREAREDRPPSPWGPAIIAALLPTAAVLWLAWKVGALAL